MKKVIAIIVVIVLVVGAIVVTHKPKKVTPPVVHKPIPVKVTHGVKPPYNDCVPNDTGTLERDHQAELTATEQAMAKYNDTPDQQDNANFQQLQTQYKEQVSKFDTCTLITN